MKARSELPRQNAKAKFSNSSEAGGSSRSYRSAEGFPGNQGFIGFAINVLHWHSIAPRETPQLCVVTKTLGRWFCVGQNGIFITKAGKRG